MINTLQGLFDVNRNDKEQDTKELGMLPICQHNIYKYSPIIVSFPNDKGEHDIILPESQLNSAKLLSINGLSEFSLFTGTIPKVNDIKDIEGKGQKYYYATFKPSESYSIENLLEQFYLSYVNSFNLDIWYEPLKDIQLVDCKNNNYSIMPEAKLIELNHSQIERIAKLHQQSCYGKYLGPIMNEIREIAKELEPMFNNLPTGLKKGDKFFWKLTTRSAKDSWFYKEQNLFASLIKNSSSTKAPLRKCEASSALDVVSAMVGSSRVSSDCESYLAWKVNNENRNPLKIVIQHWQDFPEEMEFRCFVFNGKVTAVNQLCWSTYIDYLEQDKQFQENILKSIRVLHDSIKGKLPWNNYILDVLYDKERDISQICEFNPFGPYSCTGSQLFNWELDYKIIFNDIQPNEYPVFRILKPWMNVKEQFTLCFPKDLENEFDSSFKEHLSSIVQRCPCCRRKSDSKGFKLPPTTLYHPIDNK